MHPNSPRALRVYCTPHLRRKWGWEAIGTSRRSREAAIGSILATFCPPLSEAAVRLQALPEAFAGADAAASRTAALSALARSPGTIWLRHAPSRRRGDEPETAEARLRVNTYQRAGGSERMATTTGPGVRTGVRVEFFR